MFDGIAIKSTMASATASAPADTSTTVTSAMFCPIDVTPIHVKQTESKRGWEYHIESKTFKSYCWGMTGAAPPTDPLELKKLEVAQEQYRKAYEPVDEWEFRFISAKQFNEVKRLLSPFEPQVHVYEYGCPSVQVKSVVKANHKDDVVSFQETEQKRIDAIYKHFIELANLGMSISDDQWSVGRREPPAEWFETIKTENWSSAFLWVRFRKQDRARMADMLSSLKLTHQVVVEVNH